MQRKRFIKDVSALVAGWSIVPRSVLGRGFVAPSDQLAIAGIGAGNRGFENLKTLAADDNNRIVSLCDVDERRSVDARKSWDKASYYADYRQMLDKAHKQIDAVVVSIPDHNHAVAAMATMQLGKHVYCESPLAHDLFEVRALQEAAKRYRVITQMGNQVSSGDDSRKIRYWIQKGVIGEVTKVHVWAKTSIRKKDTKDKKVQFAIPKELDWLLWLGTAGDRNFSPNFLDGGWKSWIDFGTGSLGSEGPNLIHVPFTALELNAPIAVEVGVGLTGLPSNGIPLQFPEQVTVHFRFARKDHAAVEIIWYDGGLLPSRPVELAEKDPMGDERGGMLFEGSKYKLMAGYYGRNPRIIPTSVESQLDLSYNSDSHHIIETHQTDWATACRTSSRTPVPLPGDFRFSGPLTETLLVGNLGLLAYNFYSNSGYPGRKELLWDSQQLQFSNFEQVHQFIKREYAHGFSLIG